MTLEELKDIARDYTSEDLAELYLRQKAFERQMAISEVLAERGFDLKVEVKLVAKN